MAHVIRWRALFLARRSHRAPSPGRPSPLPGDTLESAEQSDSIDRRRAAQNRDTNTCTSQQSPGTPRRDSTTTSMREMHAPTSTSDLCWFASLLDREVPFQHEDVADGFALVQLLSMIAPSHVDLSWYATDEALQMVDLTPYNYRNLQQGLQSCSFLFTEQQQHILARLVSGTDSLPSAEAALQILSVLRSVYEQEHRAPSARLRSAAPTSPEGVLPADDQTEAVAYEPSESTFKPYLRWMLLFLTSHASAVQLEQLRIAECLAQIDCNVREIAPGPLIDLLCSGRLYQLLSDYIFPQGLPTPSRSGTDTSRSMEAVDMLMERGFLSFKKNVRDSIKEMIMDKSPFYEVCDMTHVGLGRDAIVQFGVETIHQKIIDAFMSADAQARIDVAQIVSHVQSPIHFQTGPLKFSPFDLEDGLLLWFNHVQAEARSRTDGAPPAYRAAVLSCDESDDLYHAFNHWKSWLMFCGFYCGPSSIHKHIMNLDECGADSEQAFDCIYSMLESEGFPTPAFRASEAAMFFGDDSISASSLASCKALLLAFLCELLAFVSQPACKISEDERCSASHIHNLIELQWSVRIKRETASSRSNRSEQSLQQYQLWLLTLGVADRHLIKPGSDRVA
ncbi:uncharacterized protein BJ171DRAFT_470496 [Polychytrium aggregatum]|uniref:uncharacterized protein n=1 Tax=Polychytrium aggregatum TaxID=110093 RepID=UPI0022FE4D94|nr:uncharacterized protein BJ171DRAFT_470496 [Polychytrium aggregatum]KAI9209517.1 hypothetical protein BJ171DRAFT_470496 [Polychytrium aggregatum]